MSRAQYNTTTVQVDDTDPAFVYSGNWTYRYPTQDYNSTLHSLVNDGDTIHFPFNGTGIEVWGPMGSIDYDGQPVTAYSIDGGAQTTYFAPYIEPGGWIPSQQFFQSPPLADGAHTLLISNVNGTAPSRFNLDYVLFTPSTTSSTTRKSTGTVAPVTTVFTTGRGTSSGSLTSTGTSSHTTLPESTQANTSHASHTPIGAIVGGAVGGIVLMIVAFALCYFFGRERRQRRWRAHTNILAAEMAPELDPFVAHTAPDPRPSSRAHSSEPLMTSSARSMATAARATTMVPFLTPSVSTEVFPAPMGPRHNKLREGRGGGHRHQDVPGEPYTQHIDSGIRPGIELPPAYTRD